MKKRHKEISKTSVEIPPTIDQLNIDNDSDVDTVEKGYREELITELQHSLRLPEHGNVQVELVIERNGKVLSFLVLDSESQKNKRYVEQAIPLLNFPSFGEYFKKQDKHTFRVTLAGYF